MLTQNVHISTQNVHILTHILVQNVTFFTFWPIMFTFWPKMFTFWPNIRAHFGPKWPKMFTFRPKMFYILHILTQNGHISTLKCSHYNRNVYILVQKMYILDSTCAHFQSRITTKKMYFYFWPTNAHFLYLCVFLIHCTFWYQICTFFTAQMCISSCRMLS
jgi:hypothetical protein